MWQYGDFSDTRVSSNEEGEKEEEMVKDEEEEDVYSKNTTI